MKTNVIVIPAQVTPKVIHAAKVGGANAIATTGAGRKVIAIHQPRVTRRAA